MQQESAKLWILRPAKNFIEFKCLYNIRQKIGKSYEKECCLNIPNFAGSVIKKPVNTLVLTGFVYANK